RLRAVNARDLPAATTVTMTLVFDTVAAWTDFNIGSNAAYQIDWSTGALPRAAGQALQPGGRRRSALAVSAAPWRCAPHRRQHACRGAGQAHYTVDRVPSPVSSASAVKGSGTPLY